MILIPGLLIGVSLSIVRVADFLYSDNQCRKNDNLPFSIVYKIDALTSPRLRTTILQGRSSRCIFTIATSWSMPLKE